MYKIPHKPACWILWQEIYQPSYYHANPLIALSDNSNSNKKNIKNLNNLGINSLSCMPEAPINSSRNFSAGACQGENRLLTLLPCSETESWIAAYINLFVSWRDQRRKSGIKDIKKNTKPKQSSTQDSPKEERYSVTYPLTLRHPLGLVRQTSMKQISSRFYT